MKKQNFGFTLIELLIVVAIIAILAAIAIPNFLAAQVRSKVSRAKSEMRTLATGLEAYYTDNNAYVRPNRPTWIQLCSRRLEPLTTPIAYISRIPKPDPFGDPKYQALYWNYDTYDYMDEQAFIELRGSEAAAMTDWGGNAWGRVWRLSSAGPDRLQRFACNINNYLSYPSPGWPNYYDPSNGTISNGDIIRFGGPGKLNFGDALMGEIINN